MDAAKAREIYRKRNRRSKKQAFGDLVRHERSEARYRRVLELSALGVSKEAAAHDVSLSINGLNTLLYKKLGSHRWPIEVESAAIARAKGAAS